MAAAVSADPDTALRVHTREELGVDPEELPSPLLAGAAVAVPEVRTVSLPPGRGLVRAAVLDHPAEGGPMLSASRQKGIAR
jgi:hypothetical protein